MGVSVGVGWTHAGVTIVLVSSFEIPGSIQVRSVMWSWYWAV